MIISILVITIHNMSIYPWMLDDAFIFFRYAENFSLGHGLVYNLGERVEGYTSFLWVVLLALGKRIGLDIVLFSKFLGTTFSMGCIFLLMNAHRFVKNIDNKVSVIATVFLGTCGIFTPWATSGMEVTMFTFAVLLSMLFYISVKQSVNDNKWRWCFLGFICAITTLARPEGLLIFAVICIDQLLVSIKKRNRGIFYLATSFLAIYLPYFIWRYLYYGYFLPNTFYGKVGFNINQVIRGIGYALRFAIPTFFLLIPVLSTLFTRRWFRKCRGLNLLPLVVALYAVYVIFVGGDLMPAFRFFVPIVPLLCLISAVSIPLLAKTKKTIILIVTIIALYNIAQIRITWEIYHHIQHDTVAFYGKEVGLWLRENASPKAVIATNTAGSIPYFSRLKTIDMLGMNDEHIAHREIPSLGKGFAGHEKGDGAYVLSRNPDYIQFGSSLGSKNPVLLSDKEIYESQAFHDLYSLRVYRLDSGANLWIYEKRQSRN